MRGSGGKPEEPAREFCVSPLHTDDGDALLWLAIRSLRHCMLIVDEQLSLVFCNAICGMACQPADRGTALFSKVLSTECPPLRKRPEIVAQHAGMLEQTVRRVLEGGHNEAVLHVSYHEGERLIARQVVIMALYHGGRTYALIRFEDTSALEQALEITRHSEAQYTRLVENLPDIVVRFRPDLQITYVSPNIYWLTGQRPEYYLNALPERLIGDPESLLRFREALDAACGEGRAAETEFFLSTPFGARILNCRVVAERTKEGKNLSLLAVLRDITEHRRMEGELRALYLSMPLALGILECVRDAGGRVVDFVIRRVNPAVNKQLGIEAQRVIGQRLLELMPDISDFWFGSIQETAETGVSRDFEAYARRLNRWLQVHIFRMNADQVALFATDVTARRERERERATLAAALEQSENAVLLLTPQGRVSYASQTARQRYGEELIGRHIMELMRDSDYEQIPEGLQEALEAGQLFSGHCTRPDKRSRDRRTDEVKITPVRDADGQLISFAVMARDITERIRHQIQMQHVQKLESIGVLAGGIAHDFNNLLMTILGNTDLAMQELEESAPVLGFLREIEKASQHAADLCRQMLTYAGKGQIQASTVDLNSLIEGMTRLLEISVSKKVVIRQNLFAGLPPVQADASQLRQILMNLVLNASEAIGSKSGVILISTGIMACDRPYLMQTFVSETLPEGDYVYLEVSDTGCGIPPEHLGQIFDPFFTTKFLGRGLGLSAVLGIVRSHGGAIKVYSEQGKGSTFKVLFPAATGGAEGHAAARPDSCWTGHGTVLLAEDEETVRALGRRMLERMGFTVITAVDGRDCLRLFQEHADVLRLVLLDLTMPHLDGDEVFREIRRVRPDLPAVIASGYTEQEIRQRFAGKGIAGFIQKPYHLNVLRDVIRHALGE